MAAQVPHMDQEDRRQIVGRLARVMGLEDAEPEAPMEVVEHNPEKAAEWFRERGYYVESA